MGLDLTNGAALQAVESLTAAQTQLEATQTRVASGLKVASAQDDGAVWQIAQGMRSEADGWKTVGDSLARGQSILDVAASGAQTIANLLSEIQAKAVAYAGATNTASKAAFQNDIEAAVGQLDMTAQSAEFGGVNLLNQATGGGGPVTLNAPPPVYDSPSLGSFQSWFPNLPNEVGDFTFTFAGSPNEAYDVNVVNLNQGTDLFQYNLNPPATSSLTFAGTPVDSSVFLQVQTFPGTTLTSASFTPTAAPPPVSVLSDPSGGTLGLAGHDLTSAGLGLASLDWSNPAAIVSAVEGAQQAVTAAATNLGDQQNQVSSSQTLASQRVDVLQAGVGKLVDANLGKESAALQAAQLKQNLATQALAIANGEPKALLALYR